MTSPWKLLIGGVAIYSVVLTWAFVRMVTYLQWLHFSGSIVRATSLSDTTPGREVAVVLGLCGALAVTATLVSFLRHREVEARARRTE